MKIVIDTNIWISFLIGKTFLGLYSVFEKKEIEIITSRQQIEEILRVLDKPKFNKLFSFQEKEFLLHLIERNTKMVEIKSKVNVCRDKKDDFILNIALNGKADYIITGDSDLLILNPFENIQIITYRELINILQ